MKKTLAFSIIALFFGTAINSGCVKTTSRTTTPVVNLPDVTDFALKSISTFVAGAASVVSIASNTLAAGTYTIYFDLTGANNLLNQAATLVMSGGSATFNTPVLPNAGNTDIKITKIVNSSGGSSTISTNNSKSFTDSSGLFTCTVNGSNFRATHVEITKVGSTLSIYSTYWDPLTTMNLLVKNFSNTTGSFYFNSKNLDFPSATNNSTFNGSASYNGPLGLLPSANGVITITAVSPLITGTFSFKANDSSVISSGTFKGKVE